MTNLDQGGEELLIPSWGATRARVLPVDIQTIKLVLTQEADHAVDEGLTIGRSGNHGCEPGDGNTVRVLLLVRQVPLGDILLLLTFECQSYTLRWPAESSGCCSCKQQQHPL